jgi:hypothetical protein
MKFNKEIRKYLILSGILFLLIISFFALATVLIHRPGVQQYLLRKVCIGYGLDTKTGKMELDIFGACGVVIHDVETCLTDKSCVIAASSMTINFSKMRLLMGELIPVSVDIKHPVIEISEASIRSLYNKKNGGTLRMPILCRDGVNRLNIEDGELLITGPSGIVVKNLSAILEHVEQTSNTYKISGSGRIEYRGKQSEFYAKTTVDVNPDDITKSVFSASFQMENAPLVWIPKYPERIDIRKGGISADLNITGSRDRGITIGGSLKLKSVILTLINKDRSKKYNVPELNCVLDASLKDQVIHINSLNMKNRDLYIDMNMMLDLTDRDDPDLKLTAKSRFMSIKTFRRNFPFQIIKPWLKDTLFPMFEDGSVRMDELVLDGRFDQFRHLREKENQSVIGASFTCRSFIVSNMGIQVPFTGVSASVNIRDGNLKVSGLSGIFGDSRIKEGSLDVEGMTTGNPLFTVFVDGDFDVRELMSHREINVVPEKVRLRIEKFRELDGRLSAKTSIGYRRDWKAPRILKGDFLFRDTLYHERPLDLPLRFTQIDFHFPGDGLNNFSGQGTFGNSQFSVTGVAEFSESELLFKHAEIAADADMNQLTHVSLNHDNFPFKFKDFLPVVVTVDKKDDGYTYRGSLDAGRLVMESDDIIFNTAGKGNSVSFEILQHSSGKLDMHNIILSTGKSRLYLSGEYSLTDQKLYVLKIMSRDLSIGDLGIRFEGNEGVLSGNLKGILDFDFPENDMKETQINGYLIGENISFIPGVLPLPLSECSFRLDLSGEKGFINHLDTVFGEHPLHMKGILHGWDQIKGDLLVTADYIDLSELVLNSRTVSSGRSSFKKNVLFKKSDIDLKLNVSKGIWRKLEFERLNAEMIFSEKKITIKNAEAELKTGNVTLDGILGRGDARKVDINGRINLDNQAIDKLLSDIEINDLGIKGTLALKSSVSIEGNTDEGVLKNLSGSIDNMVITKGLLKNSRVFIKILDALNIPDKFKERPPELREDGFYFENLEGSAQIKKGILNTEGFVLKSPAFNAVGSGEENLYTQTHNLRLLVQPLTNIDFIISHIPIVGRILVEDNETLFTVGYDVTGPWSKPDLGLVPSENLKGLWGVFKRALLTPYKIIENISNAAKSMTNTPPEETGEDNSANGEEP